MSKLEFNENDYPTIGVELEFGILDQQTGALSSSIAPIIEALPEPVRARTKPELMQCYVEINTGVCKNVSVSRCLLDKTR